MDQTRGGRPVRRPGRRFRTWSRAGRSPRPRTGRPTARDSSSGGRSPGSPGLAHRLGQAGHDSTGAWTTRYTPTWNWVPSSQFTSNGSSRWGHGDARSGGSSGSRRRARVGRLLVAERREDRAPRPAIARDRVISQPTHGDHDVGVGQVAIEIDPPSLPWSSRDRPVAGARPGRGARRPFRGATIRPVRKATSGVVTTVTDDSRLPTASTSSITPRIVSTSRSEPSSAMATRSPGTTSWRNGGNSSGCSRTLRTFGTPGPAASRRAPPTSR